MNSHTSVKFWKAFERLDAQIQEQARTAYLLFSKNPHHPSLHFKRVHSTLPIYSARVSLNYRAVGIREGDETVWFWIGPHDDYDKLLASL